MSDSPTDGLSPLYDMRCKLTAAEKEIDRLQDRNEVLEKSAEINRRIMDSYGPRFDEYDAEIERLRTVLQRIADMPVDGYESTIPVRAIARVALEDDNENDDTDGTGVNTDWLRDDAGR